MINYDTPGYSPGFSNLRYGPYSHSKVNTHMQCPRKFKYKYVLKISEGESDKTALFKGVAVHNILENYPSSLESITDTEVGIIADGIVRKFADSTLGRKYLNTISTAKREIRVNLGMEDGKLIVGTGLTRKELTYLGFVDYINFLPTHNHFTDQEEHILNLVDWKTGKVRDLKYQDFNQLIWYAIYFFKKFPTLNNIRISYCYVEHSIENDLLLTRDNLRNYEETLISEIYSTEKSHYQKNITPLCGWCPFQSMCSVDKS